jgi:hypothetical protein
LSAPQASGKPSSLLDTRVIYCGDNLEQLRKLPDACVDLIYIDPPFNSNRNYEVFWGETREKRAFDDRHAGTTVGPPDTTRLTRNPRDAILP